MRYAAVGSQNGTSCGLGRRVEPFLGVTLPKHHREETHARKNLYGRDKNTLAIAALVSLDQTPIIDSSWTGRSGTRSWSLRPFAVFFRDHESPITPARDL